MRGRRAAGARPLLLGAADYPPLLATDRRPAAVPLGARRSRPRRAAGGRAGRRPQRLRARLPHGVAARAPSSAPPGFVVVSGLARGIDAAAHRAALATGTIAAQAGGVDVVYPPENAGLAAEIAASGLRLSEMPIGHAPRPRTSPAATASSPASPSASSWSRARCARAA